MSTRHKCAPQHNTFDLQVSPSRETPERLLEKKTPQQHWICPGCGTTHTRILPEECQRCGAIWLEFESASPGEEARRQ